MTMTASLRLCGASIGDVLSALLCTPSPPDGVRDNGAAACMLEDDGDCGAEPPSSRDGMAGGGAVLPVLPCRSRVPAGKPPPPIPIAVVGEGAGPLPPCAASARVGDSVMAVAAKGTGDGRVT